MMNPYKEVFMEIETGLLEQAIRVDDDYPPYQYDTETFRACTLIFMSALMWKLWAASYEKTMAERGVMAEKCGNDLRDLIMKYTGIDAHTFYK